MDESSIKVHSALVPSETCPSQQSHIGARSIAAAVAALLHPHAEVVLHDLGTGKIVGVWNNLSGRRVGHDSLLEAVSTLGPVKVIGPYRKTGLNGGTIRSVSAFLPGQGRDDPAAALLCINLDVSLLEQAQILLAGFVAPINDRPAGLFAGDWREALNEAVREWLETHGLSIGVLTRPERISLIEVLDARNLFDARRAAEHVARLLSVSRASIYAYLTQARQGGQDTRNPAP